MTPSFWLRKFMALGHGQRSCVLGRLSASISTTSPVSETRAPVDAEMVLSLASRRAEVENIGTNFTPVMSSEALHHSLIIRPPDHPTNPKLLKVSVLGMPNAGKSTFINTLVEKRILATSSRIDTTIENTVAVANIGSTQILFQDTPGILSLTKANRHNVATDRVSRPSNSFFDADLGIIIADLTSLRVKDGYLQPEILMTMLKNRHVPTILVLSKLDKYKNKAHLPVLIHLLTAGRVGGVSYEPSKIKLVPMRLPKVKETLLDGFENLDLMDVEDVERRLEKSETGLLNKLRHYRGWPHFEDVFVVSAKEKRGFDVIKNYMLLHAKPGSWLYHSDLVTDASPKQIILDSIRAALLEHLPNEIPYRVLPRVNEWKEMEDGRLFIEIDVICGKKSHYYCVLRKCGIISKDSREHLQDAFFMEVFVQVSPVFVKK